MDEFKKDIQEWVIIDNQLSEINQKIKDINEKAKPIRENKDLLTNKITTYMRKNNIENNIIKTKEGTIKFHENSTSAPITLKLLKQCLTEIIDDDNKVNHIFEYIKNKRTQKTYFDLQRKNN